MICKNCGSEVSPYITECPYCGNRLRKRAPKLDRDQRPTDPRRRSRRPPSPLLSRLRPGEIPGIRAERRPYATLALVLAGLIGCLLWRTDLGGQGSNLILYGTPTGHWWRLATAAFAYDNTGYAFVTIGAIALFGWLLERRHGPLVPLALFLIGGIGGLAATVALNGSAIVLGAGGAGLALAVAWAMPDVLELIGTGDTDGDLIGAAVVAVAVALMPLADAHASWISDAVGAAAGVAMGLPLARFAAR